MNNFLQACKYFSLTFNLGKTNVMGQDSKEIPSICNYKQKWSIHPLILDQQ